MRLHAVARHSQVDPFVEPVTDLQPLCPGDELLDPLFAIADGDQDAQGHAPLPCGSERCSGDGVERLLLVGVWHQDGVILGSQIRLDAFPVFARSIPDVFARGVGPDKGDGLDARVVAQKIDRLGTSVDERDDTCGDTRTGGEFDEHGRRSGITFGRFDEERVTGPDGDRQGPQRDHGRKVEPVRRDRVVVSRAWHMQDVSIDAPDPDPYSRTDGGPYAQRAPPDIRIHIRRHLQLVARQHLWQGAHRVYHLETSEDVPLGVCKRLALFEDDGLGEVVVVLPDESLVSGRAAAQRYERVTFGVSSSRLISLSRALSSDAQRT